MDNVDERWDDGELQRLEAALRKELKPVAPPDGFADRVMARVHAREAARVAAMPKKRAAFWGMHRNASVWTSVAAALVLAVGGGMIHTRHAEEERQAAQVQAQMDMAMELTGHALDQVQSNLDRSPAGQFLNGLSK